MSVSNTTKTLAVYKPLGRTPLQTITQLRRKYPQYRESKIAYAGRLDPLAEGLLLLLLDEECQNREYYQNLNKEYVFELLLGVSTDSKDFLGMINTDVQSPQVNASQIKKVLHSITGKYEQSYPAFSSKTVNGVPLYKLSRLGQLPAKMPTKVIEILSAQLESLDYLTGEQLARIALTRIDLVTGDFRQTQIKDAWREFAQNHAQDLFPRATITIAVTSGTYVRSLCADLANKLGTVGFAGSIKRTQVGKYKLADCVTLD